MPAFSIWLQAARLRTLPLATASALCGSLLAAQQHTFHISVLLLSALTAVLLQLFSNLANDYGDSLHGADHSGRIGPQRVMAAGLVAPSAMKRVLIYTATAACLSGISLLWIAHPTNFWFWIILGILSLSAAFGYTLGKHPYGYYGGGDLAVLIFFGWIGVCGSAVLHADTFQAAFLIPATAHGIACTMVLNLNNMRDIESDRTAEKLTVAVQLGSRRAVHYHYFLAAATVVLWSIWLHSVYPRYAVLLSCAWWLWTTIHCIQVRRVRCLKNFNRLLPQWSIGILLWVILLWIVHGLCR